MRCAPWAPLNISVMHQLGRMNYTLKYKDIEVGQIKGEEEDFPNLWGKLTKNESLTDEAIINFIELSIEESNLIEEDHLRDISKEMTVLEKQIEPYMYLIDSEEWVLISDGGEAEKILVPSFKSNNSIVWRWSV